MVSEDSKGSIRVIKVPNMGDSIPDGNVKKILKKVGDVVSMDEPVASIETDKVVVDIRAPEAGKITSLFCKEGDTVKVGENLYELDTSVRVAVETETKPTPKETSSSSASIQTPLKPNPDPTRSMSSPPTTPTSTPPAKPAPVAPTATPPAKLAPMTSTPSEISGARSEHRVKMTRLRSRVAERLKSAQNTYAMLTTFQEADMSALMDLRNKYKDEFSEKHNGVKLGFMSAFVKASTIALVEQPTVNAVIDGDEIVFRNYVDISVAVSTPNGLLVPVIRDCSTLSFAEIERTIAELAVKGRDGTIAIEEMAGGTFTISNGGVYGSMMGTPIVNPPQSAILGMHAITKRAVVVNDQILIRPMMYLALTYDHRLIDGREAVTFLRRIKDLVEDPRKILLDI